jgi:hypothetical protein
MSCVISVYHRDVWDLHTSVILRTEAWQFRTEILEKHIGPIFNSHAVQEGTDWPLNMGRIGCPETSVRNLLVVLDW